MKTLNKQLLYGLLLLVLILLLETYTDLDLLVQNQIYNFKDSCWPISRAQHQELSIIFYKGFKNLVIAFGVLCLLVFGLSYRIKKLKKLRKPALLMALSIILVPLTVAGSKVFTNVYCPAQLEMYGGRFPWVRVLESYPADFVQIKPGRCFPAGHATTGFALMMLYFCFQKRRNRIIALAIAIALGWITGIYQMLRGEHFISHTLFTMIASWMVILVINALVTKVYKNDETG